MASVEKQPLSTVNLELITLLCAGYKVEGFTLRDPAQVVNTEHWHGLKLPWFEPKPAEACFKSFHCPSCNTLVTEQLVKLGLSNSVYAQNNAQGVAQCAIQGCSTLTCHMRISESCQIAHFMSEHVISS